jgi:aryl-alcohol dehydrogenase-like predicted oxidoreductase
MFDREIEKGSFAFCDLEGIGILVHSPLAKGLLTGKYKKESNFSNDDERSVFPRFQGSNFALYLAVVEKLKKIAQEKGLSMVQLSIAWILRIPAVTCVLVGAKNPNQLMEHLGGLNIKFTDSELQRIDAILAHAPDVPHS